MASSWTSAQIVTSAGQAMHRERRWVIYRRVHQASMITSWAMLVSMV